MIRENKIDTGE